MLSSTLDTEIFIDTPPEIVKAVFMDWPKVDDSKLCKNFTPQLLINDTNEFRWVGTVLGKWFLAGEHWV